MVHLVADTDLEAHEHVGHQAATQAVSAEGAERDGHERRQTAHREEESVH